MLGEASQMCLDSRAVYLWSLCSLFLAAPLHDLGATATWM
jgi:hypothetical protein